MPINAPSKNFLSVGSVRVAYSEAGGAGGTPVVFLHGYPTHSFLWRRVMAGMGEGFSCLAPDLMGLGDTEAPVEGDFSLPAQARLIRGFLRAKGIARASLVGHDHGGGLAQILATEDPSSVSHLVLVDSVGYDAWPVPRVRTRAWIARRFPRLSSSSVLMETFWRTRLGLPRALRDPSRMTPEVLEEYIRPLTSSPDRRERFRRYLLACDPGATVAAGRLLGRLTMPAMVVWGSHDTFLPLALGERLARDIPRAAGLRVLRDAGHLLPEEKPGELASLLTGFLLSS